MKEAKKRRLEAVEEGVAAAAECVVDTGEKPVSIGIVAKGMSEWKWCTEAGGKLKWISGAEATWQRESQYPCWEKLLRREDEIEETLRMDPVDVVLFDGQGPGPGHPVWRVDSVTVVVWSVGRNRCHPPRDSSWALRTHAINHADLGGSTTRVNHIHVAVRTSNLHRLNRFRMSEAVSVGPGVLGQVVDRTVHGRLCLPPRLGEMDPMDRPVKPGDRDTLFALPCVFVEKQQKRVRRKLTDKEWLHCHDCPAQVLRQLSADGMKELAKSVGMPFKTRFHVIRSISDFMMDILEPPDALDEAEGIDTQRLKRTLENDGDLETLSDSPLKRPKLLTNQSSSDEGSEFDYQREEKNTRHL